ncbi:MAG: hypothetical protein M3268_05785 [Acidobacteriota bacterium]|nr:hypothetical protein [Acidobacteriota bacterium]
MAIRKTKTQTQRTDARLLLESDEPVELPPADVDESAVVLQFENVRQYVPELVETLRAGTVAELVPVMNDGSTFAVHTRTRTFWVKLWHRGDSGMTRVERVQVLVGDDEEDFDDDEFDELDDDSADHEGADDEDDAEPNVNFESR